MAYIVTVIILNKFGSMKTLTSMINIKAIQHNFFCLFFCFLRFFLCFLETEDTKVCLVYASTHYHLSVLPPRTSVCECYFCQEIN